MANKARPKKVKAPYRKYVAGEGLTHVMFSKHSYRKGDRTDKYNNISLQDLLNSDEYSEADEYNSLFDNKKVNQDLKHLTLQHGSNDSNDNKIDNNNNNNNNYSEVSDNIPTYRKTPSTGMKFPWEVQSLILFYSEDVDVDYLLVCKAWYFLCLPLIYSTPILNSKNFNKFIDSVIIDRKKTYGQYIKALDLSTILQCGRNSYVSKLLRRSSATLQKFTAPQTSFGYAPLISLKACHQLRYLDLGLISETVKLKELFAAIKSFKHLTHLAFPRSSVDCEGFREFQWPQNLKYLKLSGGITNEFVIETNWPKTIKTLELSFCPKIDENAIYTLLSQIGDTLSHLYFHYPMPALGENSLDFVFRYCTNLISIQLMVDYCSKWAFADSMLTPVFDYQRPLKTIYLESSGTLGVATKIHPDDFTIAILEGRLPCLKNIRISSKLSWDMKSEDVEDLVNSFEDQGGSLYLGCY